MTDNPKDKRPADRLINEGLEKSYLSIPHQRPRDSVDATPLNESVILPPSSTAESSDET